MEIILFAAYCLIGCLQKPLELRKKGNIETGKNFDPRLKE